MASDTDATRRLDAREIDGEPFEHIMGALETLPEDGSLLLVNSFEPEPLYPVLERRGFSCETSREAPEEWHVKITRS